MKISQTLGIAALCVFGVLHVALNVTGADTLSRGRQLLFNHGLQIQALVYPCALGDLSGFWNSNDPLPTIPEPGALIRLSTSLLSLLAYGRQKGR